jgi:hypothetical protein
MASFLPWGCYLRDKKDDVGENVSRWMFHEGRHLVRYLEYLRRGVCNFYFSRRQNNLVLEITYEYTEAELFYGLITLYVSQKNLPITAPSFRECFFVYEIQHKERRNWILNCLWSVLFPIFTLKATVFFNLRATKDLDKLMSYKNRSPYSTRRQESC